MFAQWETLRTLLLWLVARGEQHGCLYVCGCQWLLLQWISRAMEMVVQIGLQDGYDGDWCTSSVKQRCDVVSKAEIDVVCGTLGQHMWIQW